MHLSELQKRVVEKRAERGFVTDPVKITVLLMEELGELARTMKQSWSKNYPDPTKEEIGNECSDVLVLLLAMAEVNGVDLEAAVEKKFFKNDEERAWKTGKSNVP